MKKITVLIFLIFIASFFISASMKKVLTQNYVDAFVKNYDVIESDIKTIEIGHAGKTIVNDENLYYIASSLLKKYGLGNEPVEVYMAVKYGYSAVVMQDNVSAVTTSSLKAQYESLLKTYKNIVHADDIIIVEKNKTKLDSVFIK